MRKFVTHADRIVPMHHPWVLVGKVAGSVTQIGVASLVIDDTRGRPADDLQLCSALVSYLIESGDVGDLEPASG